MKPRISEATNPSNSTVWYFGLDGVHTMDFEGFDPPRFWGVA